MKDTTPWAGGTDYVSPAWGLDMERALTKWRGSVGQRGGVMAVNAFRYATRWGSIDHDLNFGRTTMTNDSKRETLIEEAAKAIWEESTNPGSRTNWEDEPEYVVDEFENQARAAFAVFEKAHAPNVSDREKAYIPTGQMSVSEPQGEPSDEQVVAAWDAFYTSDDHNGGYAAMRDALRAAGQVKP